MDCTLNPIADILSRDVGFEDCAQIVEFCR